MKKKKVKAFNIFAIKQNSTRILRIEQILGIDMKLQMSFASLDLWRQKMKRKTDVFLLLSSFST